VNQAHIDGAAVKTLIALWLARQDTEVRLSSGERAAIEEIGYRLALRPDTWESIEKELMALIQGNANLNQAFLEVRPKLDEMDKEELLDLLPSETELKATPDTSDVVTYDSATLANKAAKGSGVLEQLLVQLRRESNLQIADAQLVTVAASQESSLQQAEDDDAAFDLACALVDELNLGWDSEWQQAAITDWEVSG
jgi:antitoxin ParD1/3/4